MDCFRGGLPNSHGQYFKAQREILQSQISSKCFVLQIIAFIFLFSLCFGVFGRHAISMQTQTYPAMSSQPTVPKWAQQHILMAGGTSCFPSSGWKRSGLSLAGVVVIIVVLGAVVRTLS